MYFATSPSFYILYAIKYCFAKLIDWKIEMQKKYEYVKSLKLAGWLMQRGFRILRVEPNIKFKSKDVYVFEQSDELTKYILKYIDERAKEKENADSNRRSRT